MLEYCLFSLVHVLVTLQGPLHSRSGMHLVCLVGTDRGPHGEESSEHAAICPLKSVPDIVFAHDVQGLYCQGPAGYHCGHYLNSPLLCPGLGCPFGKPYIGSFPPARIFDSTHATQSSVHLQRIKPGFLGAFYEPPSSSSPWNTLVRYDGNQSLQYQNLWSLDWWRVYLLVGVGLCLSPFSIVLLFVKGQMVHRND